MSTVTQTYDFYVAWIYVGVALLACSFGIAIWVGWCFKKHAFPVVWWVANASKKFNGCNIFFYCLLLQLC